jgi:methylenetetrahydrofolate dehydrogenase (NADP+)/methenyltetrahydrofolate cyclohydrolase
MEILDGKKINQEIMKSLKNEIAIFDVKPRLVIIQIGNNEASNIYIERKVNFAVEIGCECKVEKLKNEISEEKVVEIINKYNSDESVHGIIVQLPIPEVMDNRKILNSIDYRKDVDGLSNINLSKLVNNEKGIVPATARGILTLLKQYNISVEKKNIVVLGRSTLVGKSTALLMLNQNSTVTVCHSNTVDLDKYLKSADIIITATGQHGVINESNIGENQVVIDVGTNFVENKLVGDVKLNNLDKVSYISPVPGGVGPMTVASLFQNLLDSYKKLI